MCATEPSERPVLGVRPFGRLPKIRRPLLRCAASPPANLSLVTAPTVESSVRRPSRSAKFCLVDVRQLNPTAFPTKRQFCKVKILPGIVRSSETVSPRRAAPPLVCLLGAPSCLVLLAVVQTTWPIVLRGPAAPAWILLASVIVQCRRHLCQWYSCEFVGTATDIL